MKHKTPLLIILLILFVPPFSTANTSEPEKITPLADTYVDLLADSNYGQEDHLEVSEHEMYFSIIFLMFDISHILNAPSEVKLRLYCYLVDSPHVVGVHWCVNNTWNEENLTRISYKGFRKTDPEDAIIVNSIAVWYEWKVTNFIIKAIEENYKKITLTLEVEDPLKGIARSRYASKDQSDGGQEFSPQLVFTYLEPQTNPLDIPTKVALGLTVTVAIAFLAYKFSKRRTRKKWRTRRKGLKK